MSVTVGEVLDGTIADVMEYGAFVKLDSGDNGLVHISEISKNYVKDIHTVVKTSDRVKVKVISINENGKIALSIKKAVEDFKPKYKNNNESFKTQEETTLDDMLSKFLKDSDERQLDLKRSIESKRGSSRKRA